MICRKMLRSFSDKHRAASTAATVTVLCLLSTVLWFTGCTSKGPTLPAPIPVELEQAK